MLDELEFTSIEQIKAYADDLRLHLLHLLIEKPYTGSQLARLLNLPRQKIHYHLKVLKDAGLIVVQKESEVKGLRELYYRTVARAFYVPEDDVRSLKINEFIKSKEGAIIMAHLDLVKSDIQNHTSTKAKEFIYCTQETALLTPEQLQELRQELSQISRKARRLGDANLENGDIPLQAIRLTIFNVPITNLENQEEQPSDTA